MKVLVACEFSGVVREAFRKKGHEAFSCDLLPNDSKYHIRGDVLDQLDNNWDLMIAHPPCTYLCSSGATWYYHPDDNNLPTSKRRPHPKYPNRRNDQKSAIKFVLSLYNSNIDKIAVENPIGVLSTLWKKPDQIIQPFHFGDPHRKSTCLWLKNLPKLIHTNIVEPQMIIMKNGKKMSKFHYDTFNLPAKIRGYERSKTFQGIADAMADQWG